MPLELPEKTDTILQTNNLSTRLSICYTFDVSVVDFNKTDFLSVIAQWININKTNRL